MKTDSSQFFTEKCKFVAELFRTSDLTDSFPSHDQFYSLTNGSPSDQV